MVSFKVFNILVLTVLLLTGAAFAGPPEGKAIWMENNMNKILAARGNGMAIPMAILQVVTPQETKLKCKEAGSFCIPGAQHDCCSGVCFPVISIFAGACAPPP